MTDDLHTRLVASVTRALRAAAFDCPGDCGLTEADCDAQHPIQVEVLHFDVPSDVCGPIDAIAVAVVDGLLAEGLSDEAPQPCTWPACESEAEQQRLADDVLAGMLGEPTEPGPDPRVVCGCVESADLSESRTWTVTTTVTAPTPQDAERWAGGIAQMVQAEFRDSMRLDVVVAPAATPRNTPLPTPATAEVPVASRPFEGAEIGVTEGGQFAWRCNGGQGCEGWVGLGLSSEEAAWAEFQRHVSDEHAPASVAGAATPDLEPRFAEGHSVPMPVMDAAGQVWWKGKPWPGRPEGGQP